MTGVMIGVPHLGDAAWPFVESILSLKVPNGFTFVRRGPAPVDIARNQIVSTFLASSREYLLMVDSDAVLHPLTLERLLSWNVPVVAALAFMRKGPMMPTVYRDRRDENSDAFQVRNQEVKQFLKEHQALLTSKSAVLEPRPTDALFEVDRTGCHCVLIHRDVVAAIPAPWFVRDELYNAKEDFYFYEQTQKAGFPIYVDFSCMAGHLYGDRSLAALDYIVWDASSEYTDSTIG